MDMGSRPPPGVTESAGDIAPAVVPEQPQETVSVGVLITLDRGAGAGGHVKCWERFAEAAVTLPPDVLDLTIYTLGPAARGEDLGPSVRFRALPPRLGTARIPFLQQDAGHTDLAGFHPRLAQCLTAHDVLHTTDTFAFARTALRVATRTQRHGLVASIHTDLPTFTRVYSRDILARLVGTGWLGRQVLETWDLPTRLGNNAAAKLRRALVRHDRILVSKVADQTLAESLMPADRVSWLRRGIDLERFHPCHRDRTWLAGAFGVPEDRPVLMFAGRVDDSKKAMTLGHAARRLLDTGVPLHVLVVGDGKRRDDLRALLGSDLTAPGALPQDQLPSLYAAADLFVFPSESEVSPNVVLEARASGLPVVLSARDGGARYVLRPGEDGVLVDSQEPETWAAALRPLLADGEARRAMGAQARAGVEATVPTWRKVLLEDLLPVWRAAAAMAQARPR